MVSLWQFKDMRKKYNEKNINKNCEFVMINQKIKPHSATNC